MSADWFDQPNTGEAERVHTSRAPLYFLVTAVVALLIAVVVLVYTQVITTGRSIADGPSGPASSSEGEQGTPTESPAPGTTAEETTAEPEPAFDTATIAQIASDTTCETDNSDGPAIISYASDVIAAEEWNQEHEDAIMEALRSIDKACDKGYSLYLQDELTDTTSPPQLNSLVADRAWISPERPAPDDAIEVRAFTTPAKNIQCGIEDGVLDCSIYTYDYPSPEGCEGYTATYVLTETNEVDAGCEYAIKTDNVLEYGTNVVADGLACELAQDGVTCWSELSGHGFTLTRADDTVF